MVVILLIAGIAFLLAGLLAIGFGIPVKEFSFGNTLILTGTVAACTGMIMLGLGIVVRELKNIARRLGPGVAAEDAGFLFSPDQPAAEQAGNAEQSAPSPQPWQEDAASRDRVRGDVPAAPEPVETAPAAKPRRNLLFSSLSRRERERAEARTADPSAPDARPPSAGAPPTPESSELPPATFEDAWPKSERSRADAPRRSGRGPSTFTEASADAARAERQAPGGRKEDQPPVTVLKSGVVDGMAYSLYSDGSIEAQMPEGMMRFASIDELRAHLDQRP
jgi:hypothetical protein